MVSPARSSVRSRLEQRVGQLAMIGRPGVLRANAGDFRLQQGHAIEQFVLGICVQRLLGQEARRISALTGEVVFHCIAASPPARLLSMGADPREGGGAVERTGKRGIFKVRAIPETMQAVAITRPGGPDVLQAETRPVPAPGPGQVLLRVSHAGVNRPDCLQRAGAYPPPPGASDLPGLEVAGEVVALGEGVTEVLPGQRVCALVNGGGYAEYCLAVAGCCLPVPHGLSLTEAAAMPETLFTVWHNVFQRGHLRDGEVLLVHGGTSGIGTMAIKLARLFDATVIATCGDAAKCAAALEVGATHAINYREADFGAEVLRLTGGRGADVILDVVGGPYTQRNLDCLAVEGRLVTIATLGGPKADIHLGKLMVKRQVLTGSTLRPRTDAFKAALAQELAREVWPLVAEGILRPQMDRTYPLAEAAAAHRRMEAGEHVGKIVLTVGEGE